EDQELRRSEHRLRDAESLPHAEGVGADFLVEAVGHADERRDAIDLAVFRAQHPREMLEILATAHESIEIGCLDDAADAAHRIFETMLEIEAADLDRTVRRS